MSHLVFQPTDASQWQQLFSGQFKRLPKNAREDYPIPAQLLPILAEHRILAAGTSSQSARSTWRYGGSLTAVLNCGATEFGSVDLNRYPLPCNGVKLCILPAIATAYQLRFDVPWWFEEVTLTIYQYIGTVTDSTEALILALQAQINATHP